MADKEKGKNKVNDIHSIFFFLPTYLPYFLPDSPEKQQINLVWPNYGFIVIAERESVIF